MATENSEVTVDLSALDAAPEKNAEKGAEKPEKGSSVVMDPDVGGKSAAADPVTPEEGVEKLRERLRLSEEARQAAETRANEAAHGEAEARGRAQTTELDLVKSAIATVTQANDVLESKYAEAMASQDWGVAAKLQRKMSDNSAKLAQLEAGKTQLEKAPKPTPRAPTDPVEALCSQLSAPSAAWVRAHPEFARDPHKYQQMIAAHQLATARGYRADSDEYFSSIEKTLDVAEPRLNGNGNGAAQAGNADPLADPSAAQSTGGRQSGPPAAPVSRSSGGAGGSRSNVVRLSAEEVEIAEQMGMTPEEYARNKVALRKEGKLS